VAGVLLTRHLRQAIPTGNGGRVCARPITTDLYQLYQQDTQGIAPDRPTYRESDPEKPVTGVTGIDAVGFAHWATNITGSNPAYRLPNFSEINDPALQRVFPAPTPESPAPSIS
jgi:formylglycine-generating enzyme required for sulfatase activity